MTGASRGPDEGAGPGSLAEGGGGVDRGSRAAGTNMGLELGGFLPAAAASFSPLPRTPCSVPGRASTGHPLRVLR